MTSQLDELKALYPIFEFRNKTNKEQTILLNRDSKTVPARGTLKLRSSVFIQLPPLNAFTYIKPTLDDLRAVGLLNIPTATPAPTSVEESD